MTGGLCSALTELDGTSLTYGSKGAVFSIEKESNAPTVRTGKYIFFGRVDVEVQAANGKGIVTSAVLQSDDLDEIDWEWVGGDNTQAQSNYFSKGDTTTYDRGAYHTVSNPLTSFHTYSVEWTSKSVQWIIDGATVRTLTYEDAKNGATFPQTPMEIKLGTWVAGGKDSPEGTVEWAGGYTDFSQAPFLGYYKSISIVDYAGSDGPTDKSVKEYIYGDNSGTYESIKVVTGDSSDDDSSSTTTKKAETTTKATKTKDADKTTKTFEPSTTKEAETTTKEDKTTTAVTSTFTTATSTGGANTTTEASSTETSGATTTNGAPAVESTPPSDAATRGVAAFGAVAMAGAFAVFAQLL